MTGGERPTGRVLLAGRRHYLVAAGVMIVLLGAFFSPLYLRGQTFSAVADVMQYVHPWAPPGGSPAKASSVSVMLDQADFLHPRQVFLHRTLKTDGAIPLWDPMSFGGHPFFAESGSRLAYPPLVQLSLFFDPSWTHDLYIILHLFVAGIAAYALMRTFGVGMGGALLTGVAWAFSSYTLTWIMLEQFVAAAALLPVGVLCVRRWYDRDSWNMLLAGAFVMGLLFIGSSVENSLFCYLCVIGYAASLALLRLIREWRNLTPGRRVALVAAPAVLALAALGVAAVALLPYLELSALSERASIAKFPRQVSETPLTYFLHLLSPPRVYESVFLAVRVVVSGQVFVGTAVALLAAVGLFLRRPGSGLGRSLVVLLFLFTLGTPLTTLALRLLPPLKELNGFGRSLFLWNLGLAVLGGLGLDALLRLLRTRAARAADASVGRRWTALAVAVVALCIAVTGAQLLAYGRDINPPFQDRSETALYPSTPGIDAVRAELGGPLGRSRVIPVSVPGRYSVLLGASGMALDLPSVGGYNTVLPATVTKLSRVIAGEPVESALATDTPGTFLAHYASPVVRTDLLARTGIAAVLGSPEMTLDASWAPAALPGRGLRQTYAGPDATVYQVIGRIPRATVVTEAIWAGSSPEALRRFVDRSFDGRRQVVLEGDPSGPTAPAGPIPAPAKVEWREDRPDTIRLSVTAQQPGWLVLLDGWDKGWKATVNGRAAEVRRANYNFRAVAVPAGTSTVDFSYQPASVTVGGWITVVSITLIACAMVPEWARRRRAARRARRRLAGHAPTGYVAPAGTGGETNRV
ncbi:MAG TPA: YfhO family protein [Acidimicrobiales bacterium]|nr:YfhO family protein [Acidimicrobiales bacterium]